MKKRSLIIGLAILCALASIPIGLVGVASIASNVDEYRFRPTTEFNSVRWKAGDLKYRFSVVDTVVGRIVLPGMKEPDVIKVLGSPDAVDTTGLSSYHAKRPGIRFINFSGGGIRVDYDPTGAVIRVSDTRWVD